MESRSFSRRAARLLSAGSRIQTPAHRFAGFLVGYGLKPGRTVEAIADAQEVYKRLCHSPGGTPEAFMKCNKVGKTALKDEVRALSAHQGKALEAELNALLSGCVESKASAPTIERINWPPSRQPA